MKQPIGLQTPFLQPDLITASDFVSYCRDNGVDTDLDELEYFDRERLLLPAIRIRIPTASMRKVYTDLNSPGQKDWKFVHEDDLPTISYDELDPETYYISAGLKQSVFIPELGGSIKGFHYGNDGWLNPYQEEGLVHYPAKEEFIPWSEFHRGTSFSTDLSEFENDSELMYAKHQLYPLKHVQRQRRLTVKDAALFRTKEEWAEAGAKITDMFTNGFTSQVIREEVVAFNEFFSVWIDIRGLRLEKHAAINETYYNGMKSYEGTQREKERLIQDDIRQVSEEFDDTARPMAKEIMESHHFALEKLQDYRFTILNFGLFGTGSHSSRFRKYVSALEDATLNNTEDAYNSVNELSWFIHLLETKNEVATAKQLILHSMDYHCKYCGKGFTPQRSTQIYTCGRKECKQKQQNEHKKEMRRLGKYANKKKPHNRS
jgi:hypothetical protein